ncbi:MAG: 1-acyl-sn-glycerol-3-phosphate acyltransferase [Chitinophagaceae bacterium]|nr:1-acyl-sn-glycerol-3-phosphate acyltransferase [Chitinophagaceae bacterium]
MKMLLKPVQWLYCIYALLLFVGIMLVIFPFVIIASLFGRIRGANMVLRICMFWGDLWFPLIFIFTKKIYEVPHDKSRSFIFVNNHISYLDACILVRAYRQPVRPLGRAEMSKVPVFGYIYRNAIVTVDRSNPENRAKSVMTLKSVLRKGISILVFPEGTFNMEHRPLKSFYDGAFRIAIETQTPIKPVLFLDAYSRMHYESIFSLTPGRCRILYMDEIPVAGLTIDDVALLRDKVYSIMEKKLIEYRAAWIQPSAKETTAIPQ